MTAGRTPEGPRDDDGDVGIFEDRLSTGTDAERDPSVVAFVAALRAEADRPAPEPRGALAELLLAGGVPEDRAAAAGVVPIGARPRRSPGRRAARTATQVALGLGIAVASVGAAAAVDGVPAVLQEPARTVVEAVSDVFTSAPGRGEERRPDGSGAGEGRGATTTPSTGPSTEPGSTGGRGATGGSLPGDASETAVDAVDKAPRDPAEPGRGFGRPTDAPDERRPEVAPGTPAQPGPTARPSEPGKADPTVPALPQRPTPSPRPTLPPPGDLIDEPGGPSEEKTPERP